MVRSDKTVRRPAGRRQRRRQTYDRPLRTEQLADRLLLASIVFLPQPAISEPDMHRPVSTYAADLDGDGDVDILSSAVDNTLGWYENSTFQVAGDANLDCQFDQLDLVQVLQAGKYLTGETATSEEGDWNGDRVFDQLDIVFVQLASIKLQAGDANRDLSFDQRDIVQVLQAGKYRTGLTATWGSLL